VEHLLYRTLLAEFAAVRMLPVVLEAELIQFYRSETLDEILEKASQVCEFLGFPFLSLTWTPAPGPAATMQANHVLIWDNYSDRIGAYGNALKLSLAESVSVALTKSKSDTQACQEWKIQQTQAFQMIAEAPSSFYLTEYQRQLLAAFGEREWTEFCAYPLCKERDRTLILVAKTQSKVSAPMISDLCKTFEVFESAYRYLHGKAIALSTSGPETHAGRTLSRREVECLQWLASGKTLFEAAKILGISERTIRFHIANARERLGVSTTVQAIVTAALVYGFDPLDTRRSIYSATRAQIK
jgi:DNA-binding CsgD family transcriptional regulator